MRSLQEFRSNFVKEQCEDSQEFKALQKKYGPKIAGELQRIVAIRKAEVEKEELQLDEISQLLKEKKIAPKSDFTIMKYYPKNDVHRFRPYGKVSGITEGGESADVCEPPAWVPQYQFGNVGFGTQ